MQNMNKANRNGRVERDAAEALASALLACGSPNQTEVIRTKTDLLKVKPRTALSPSALRRPSSRRKFRENQNLSKLFSFVSSSVTATYRGSQKNLRARWINSISRLLI